MALKLKYDFTKPIWDDADDQIDAQKGPSLDVVRASTASVTDYFNVIKTVKANEPRFTGGRRVENHFIQSAGSTWLTTLSNASVSGSEITLSAAGGYALKNGTIIPAITKPGTYTISCTIQKGTKDGTVNIGCQSTGDYATITPTSTPTRVSHTYTHTQAAYFGVVNADANTGTVICTDWQFENVSGQDDPSPSEYIATTTAAVSKWYNTQQDGSALTTPITGLLVEEARTNICLQSEDFGTTWANVATTETVNDAIAPDGTTTADKLEEDGTAGGHYFTVSTTFADATNYCYSCYFKSAENTTVQFSLGSGAFSGPTHANFNLSTGAVGTSANVVSTGIEDAGNGWYRCWLVALSTAAAASSNQVVLTETDSDDRIPSYTGTAGNGVYAWGAQLEAGAFPTSYIPTVAASVTRNADAIETTDVSWLNANAGTLYVKETLHGTTTQDGVFLNDNTNDNLIGPHHAAGDVTFLVRVSDTNQANIIAGTLTLDTELQVAGAWSANDFAVSLDGASVVTDSAGTIPTVTQFTLASPPAYNNNLHKIHISEIRYYNERLSNTALENMSNGIFPALGSGGAALFWWW